MASGLTASSAMRLVSLLPRVDEKPSADLPMCGRRPIGGMRVHAVGNRSPEDRSTMVGSQGKLRSAVHVAMSAAFVAVMATAMGTWEQAPLQFAGVSVQDRSADRTMRAHAVRKLPRVSACLLP